MERIAAKDWLETVLKRERQCHQNFFGREFSLASFQEVLEKYGFEAISRWQGLSLEPHFLPNIAIPPDVEFPGGRVRIDKTYLFFINQRKVFRYRPDGIFSRENEPLRLEGITVLIETRAKPPYDEVPGSNGRGKQMFRDDNLLGPIIKQLSQEHKIDSRLIDDSSRFGLITSAWEKIRPVLADVLKVEISQVRLERFIEYLVIPWLYPDMPRSGEKDDGRTAIWLEEYYLEWPEIQIATFFERYPDFPLERLSARGFEPEGHQLDGYTHWDPWCQTAIRPLIVLGSEPRAPDNLSFLERPIFRELSPRELSSLSKL